ncbi:Plexin-B3 [Bagarius yarrelli]|uniref:Plexin-B3 n=1 Tax=Bagarius yarrelli TaxID=175774 RepID=A0A556V9L4_BAGYA|nr:Plexin-B3 [Bagarius yarrelli]
MQAAAPLLPLHTIRWWPLVLVLLSPPLHLFALANHPTFTSLHDASLNHLLLDSSSGYVYVGAVNTLYHLSPDLQLLSWGKTGPTLDSPDCLPPIEPKDCSQARQTNNTNQLLLLEKQEGSQAQSLIVCGTVLQGICEKRSLANVSQVLYQTANPVDTHKGPGGIPPITLRRLEQSYSSPAFSHEELGKLVVGSYSKYNNQFVKALHYGSHIYFLFSRRYSLKTRDYQTYISRLCAGDPSFYSYVEVPLSCAGGYNLAQAAAIGNYREKATIFIAMAAGQASTPTPTRRSALCVYSMEELDQALERAQLLCYTQEGNGDKEQEAYIAYEVSSKCLKIPLKSVSEYPCGGEHTPSPIASSVPLQATPAITWETQLSAVAVATEAGHTIALLGDTSGQLYKHFDCHSCLSFRDPYCGWCSLEGRCTRKLECARHSQPHHWLWSFGHERQCVSIQNLEPAVQSREEQTQVSFSVLPLPALSKNESLSCAFGVLPAEPAIVDGNRITCQSPPPRLLPPNPPGSDHMTTRLALMFGKVTVSDTNITFYDCRAVGRLNSTSPCMACVSSEWPCRWCARDELCTHNHSCPQQHIIYNSREKAEPHGADACPCVWALESSALIPVGVDTQLLLQGKNLDIFKFQYTVKQMEYLAPVYLQRGTRRIDSAPHLRLQLYNCSVGQSDCSQCRAVPEQYGCVWCGGGSPRCVFHKSCTSLTEEACPPPLITEVWPLTGPLEGGVDVTVLGSNLGQRYEDIENGVTVAGVACKPLRNAYLISTRIMCELQPSINVTSGPVVVTVGDSLPGRSQQTFTYQNPKLIHIVPSKGPMAGGTRLTVHGTRLLTGQSTDLRAFVGSQPCHIMDENVSDAQLVCRTSHSNQTAQVPVRVQFGRAERTVGSVLFHYLEDPVITDATPTESFYGGGRNIMVTGQNLDVVQQPMMSILYESKIRRRRYSPASARNSTMATTPCVNVSSEQMSCLSPKVPKDSHIVRVWFEMDNVHLDFKSIKGTGFTYHPDPELYNLNREDPKLPIRFKPGGVLAVEGKGLTLAMSKEEVVAWLGDQICDVKTLDDTHLYCEPPEEQPLGSDNEDLPRLKVVMGKLVFDLGTVEYDMGTHTPVPLEAQVGLAAGASVVVLIVLVIILMYSDVGGPGIPFLDYRTYAERIFFPGQRGAPLSQNLDLPEFRRQTVEQGLSQLNILLSNRLFLTRFIHTLEEQQNFSQRDRGYVASLLTMALHDKLEYFTDVMKTLLGDLVQQYVAKNPKLMLRRTETVVEKMLTNWMSICLYSFLKEVAGEPLYMLYRAIKYQVDKGPVDAVTGKAKRTLNDSHLLREDIDYCSMTLMVLVKNGVEVQPCPIKVLDVDTITQVKDKILDQIYKGAPFSQRPSAESLDLEWRSGQAGHLTLSDDDVTGIVQGHWKKLNTLQHYKVPDGATVALIPRSSACVTGINQIFQTGEKTPMLEGEEDEGLRLWHLVKSSEDPEIPKHRKSSMRERERAKAIPEIYLTRLLSMKGTLQKFVDDVFVAILSTKRPPPIAVRFFFDFLDDMAEKHGIDDPETVHIWKTNSLPLRFWVNILKNPQFVFDVQVTDSIDAVLSVIAQTFIDSCTTSEHKVGRDSPVNKLLYAREIPRYKQLVERYYSDIHSAASGCYQEMNSMLTELSGSFASEMNTLVALHELYKYINKYYDQIIMALEEDPASQKIQLAYRLQQVAALVENKVTDLSVNL